MIYDVPAKWLLYVRKSVGRTGISRQRLITTGHLAKNGGTVSAEFSDADSTAFRNARDDIDAPLPPRPGFDEMLAEMARRPGVGVAAWHIDRLGRDPEAAEILLRECRRGNHLIRTASGGDYDVTNANGRSRLRADISHATYEVDHAVERMVAAKAEAAEAGQWLGGPRPFGWRVADDGALELDPGESGLIASACSAVLSGGTLVRIARDWHAAGVTGTRGGRQAPEAIRKVLMRPRNAGLMEHRGQVVPGAQWPAIVDEDTWRAVRAILSDPSRRTSPGPAPRWLMTGVALCGACGATMLIGRSGSRAPAYRCSKAQRKLPRRAGAHVSRDAAQVDAFIRALVIGRLEREDAAALLRPDHSEERAALQAELAKLEARKGETWRLYEDGVITDWEVRQSRERTGKKEDELRHQLNALEAADALAPFLDAPEQAWDSAPLDRRQAVVSALMHVTILSAPPPDGLRRVGVSSFDPRLVDVRWVRRLPSDS